MSKDGKWKNVKKLNSEKVSESSRTLAGERGKSGYALVL